MTVMDDSVRDRIGALIGLGALFYVMVKALQQTKAFKVPKKIK
jgi:hypothetical protein